MLDVLRKETTATFSSFFEVVQEPEMRGEILGYFCEAEIFCLTEVFLGGVIRIITNEEEKTNKVNGAW